MQFWLIFWFTGNITYFNHDGFLYGFDKQRHPRTHIWNMERQRWIKGPNLPSLFEFARFCLVSLNSSTVMFIVETDIELKVFIYDFHIMKWSAFPTSNLIPRGVIHYCTAVLYIDKHLTK